MTENSFSENLNFYPKWPQRLYPTIKNNIRTVRLKESKLPGAPPVIASVHNGVTITDVI